MLMKRDAEKEYCTLSIHKSQCSKLPVAFTFEEESFHSGQRHENETEFHKKVHNLALHYYFDTVEFFRCSFKPWDQDFIFFFSLFPLF